MNPQRIVKITETKFKDDKEVKEVSYAIEEFRREAPVILFVFCFLIPVFGWIIIWALWDEFKRKWQEKTDYNNVLIRFNSLKEAQFYLKNGQTSLEQRSVVE